MPNPGQASIKAIIISTPLSVKGFNTTFVDGIFTNQLAQGISDGWGSLYPTTPSTCENGIDAALSSFINSGWEGQDYIRCLGKGIDDEVQAWVSSWDNDDNIHYYAPSVGSIVASMKACFPRYNHTDTLRTAVATAFMAYFVQEAG